MITKKKYRILVIKLKEKRPLEDLDIDMWLILKGIAKIKTGWLDFSGSGQEHVSYSSKNHNKIRVP
jgi:hypothetical protein